MSSDFQLPVDVKLTGSDVTKSRFQAPLREGWYKFRVKFAEATQTSSVKGTFYSQLTLVPLDEADNEAKRTKIKYKLYYPFRTASGHKPNTMGVCEQYLAAAMPKKFTKPKRTANGYTLNGEDVTPAEAKELYAAIDTQVAEELNLRAEDSQRFLGDEFYGKVVHKVNENNPDQVFPEVVAFSFSATAPEGVDIITSDFTSAED